MMERVARAHMAVMLRVARAAGLNEDDAYDAVQDALLVFVQRASDFDGRAPVRNWLIGIVYRKCQERRRETQREHATSDLDDEVERLFDADGRWVRAPLSPEAYAASGQAMAWLARCLEALPERRRLAFVLRDVEQLETTEICKILELTPNTLGVLLFRARNALRECLEAKGIRGARDVAM